jgi:hypothetical protein
MSGIGVERDPGSLAGSVDGFEALRGHFRGLDMEDNEVRVGEELLNQPLRFVDHQVGVNGHGHGPAHGPGQRYAEAEIGHKVAIHYVEVNSVGAGVHDCLQFPRQMQEIAVKD